MRRIHNREVLHRLSFRILRAKAKKNLIAILAIVLTTVLFTAVFVVGGSIFSIVQEDTMRQVGTSAHAGFKNLLPSEFDAIAADWQLADSSYDIFVGFLTDEKLNKLQCEVRFYQEKQAEWNFCRPTKGREPLEEDEIAVSTLVLDALKLPHKVGVEVPVTIQTAEKVIKKTFRLCGFWEGDPVAGAQQCRISWKFCEKAAPEPTVDYATFLSGRGPKDVYAPTGYYNVNVQFPSAWNLEKQAEELRERLGYDETVKLGVNWAYGFSSVDLTSVLLAAGALLLIGLSGYLNIYNIFYINIYNDIRFYGLLKAIGTTGRQLRAVVRRQALLLCLAGIPLGLGLGYLIGCFLVPVTLQGLEYNRAAYEISASPLIFAGAALFSLITVLVSSQKPCRVAGRVSAVEAVRYSEVEVSGTKRGKKIRKVSPFRLAVRNLGRNKRKFAVTVLSLSLSLILFNSVYTMVTGFSLEDYLKAQVAGDVSVTWVGVERPANGGNTPKWDAVTPAFLEQLKELPGVERVSPVYLTGIRGTLEASGHWDRAEDILTHAPHLQDPIYRGSVESMRKTKSYSATLYGLDEALWDSLELKEGIFDREKFASGDYILVNDYVDIQEESFSRPFYHVGEKVTLEVPVNGEENKSVLREFEVMAVGSLPYAVGCKRRLSMDENLILPSEVLLSMIGEDAGALRAVAEVEEAQIPQVENWISRYCTEVNTELTYVSRATFEEEFYSLQMTFWVVGGLLSLILGIIGVLNFINAVVTSILARRQELAMLEAVGMTGRQLKGMLKWEGTGYAAATYLVCLTLGTLVSFAGVQLIGRQMDFFQYRFTLLPLGICLPFLLAISLAVPALAYRSACKASVVDRIRRME